MGNGKHLYRVIRIRRRAFWGAAVFAAAVFAALFTVSAATAGAGGEGEGVTLPVVMYHAMLKDEKRHGKYVISPDEFENDLCWLEDHGYTTVLIEDLLSYTRGGSLPEKPILLTFDDGYYNNYLYAFEIARRHQAKFVISPIGYFADAYTDVPDENAYYSHATWEQLKEMADSGLVEVENHSYDLHRDGVGVKKKRGETEEHYEKRLSEDLNRAQEAIFSHVGKEPTAFVYPFGAVSKPTPELVKKLGFSVTLTCEERKSRVTRDPRSLYDLGRYLRPSGMSAKEFFTEKMGLK